MSMFNKNNMIFLTALLIVIISGGLYWYFSRPVIKEQLIVSTTSSLYETGVLDELKSRFEAKYLDYNVSFISQGTGLAIETAKNGDADMILVHSPSLELGFLESGYGVNRKIFAYNFFIIVGPESDPAGITGMDPLEALKKISEKGPSGDTLWVSRGDNSGTHNKEKSLWKASGLDLESLREEKIEGSSKPWYIEAGARMTATLQLANQEDAYTLTDIATYLKNYVNKNIELVKVVDSGKPTLNVYSAIVCNPDKNPRGMFEGSMLFLQFLVGEEVQSMLVSYGKEEFGSTLFTPWLPELAEPNSDIVQWVEEAAYFEGEECPSMYRHQAGNLYK